MHAHMHARMQDETMTALPFGLCLVGKVEARK